jgi:hypothetical protein
MNKERAEQYRNEIWDWLEGGAKIADLPSERVAYAVTFDRAIAIETLTVLYRVLDALEAIERKLPHES